IYTLQLLGADDIANFDVTISGYTTGKNVNSYTVTPTVAHNDNYNDCSLEPLTWQITPLAVDLSGVTWNYSEPFTYTRENRAAKTFSVALNLPNGLLPELQAAIDSIQSGEFSNSAYGVYTATAKFSELADAQGIQGNYDITLPNLPSTLTWEISVRNFSSPQNPGTWAEFDGELHDIAALCGLPADWAEYLDISVSYTSPSGAQSSPEGFKFSNAGEYSVTFTVKSGINGTQPNVLLGEDDEPKTVDIEVATLDLTVVGWNGSTSSATAKFSSAVPSSVYSYIFYDEDGNEVELSVIQSKTPGTYTKAIRPSENYSVTYEEEVAEEVVFTITEQGGETPVEPDDPTPPGPVEPDDPTPPPSNDGGKVLDKIKAFFKNLIEKHFPLWQVIVMGVS
ncbi:MAG: hypothetical protein K2N18_02225, partial [Clostridia bacterium]|nr:hypothetical protein [Clostridia bacterium]